MPKSIGIDRFSEPAVNQFAGQQQKKGRGQAGHEVVNGPPGSSGQGFASSKIFQDAYHQIHDGTVVGRSMSTTAASAASATARAIASGAGPFTNGGQKRSVSTHNMCNIRQVIGVRARAWQEQQQRIKQTAGVSTSSSTSPA